MYLREEIKPFIDGNGLVMPNIYTGEYLRGSDNGVMFTSEYYILLNDNNQLDDLDKSVYKTVIESCSVEPGLVARAPGVQQGGPPPDDLYAIAAASKTLNLPEIAKAIVDYGDKHHWVFNADRPGNPHWGSGYDFEAWLGRQIPLVCALRAAAGLSLPGWLRLATAAVIATSCAGVKKEDTDARRLAFHLVRAVEGSGGILDWACNIWWSRLRRDYGDEGMRGVALLYYQGNHPFKRFWRNRWDITI